MQKRLFFLLVLSFFLSDFAKSQDKLKFYELTWDEALESATKTGKMIFVEGYVNWSQPCEILEQYTFTNQQVVSYFNEHFINLQVDMDDYPGNMLADAYDVTSFPSLLFINPTGQLVHQLCGAVESEVLLDAAKIAQSDNSLLSLSTKFKEGDRSYALLMNYSLALQAACIETASLADLYFAKTDRKDWMNETSWMMLNLNVSDPYSEPFQNLLAYRDMYVLKYGKDTVDAKIYNVLIDQLIAIYEGQDLTLFATQALRSLMNGVEFEDKEKLVSMIDLKKFDLKEDWENYANTVVKVVAEQKVTDPDQLNDFGWKFYLYVNNKTHLQSAKNWLKVVIDNYPDATYLDTYASLNYKLGDQKEAVKYAKKAVNAAEEQVEELEHYIEQLTLFESGY